MDEQAEKVISWIKERKIFAWMFGTFIFTCVFVLASYAITKIVAPDVKFAAMVGTWGLMFIIILPALSFALTRKITDIFLIESEERERWRQRELKRILGDLKNARKMIWNMGFSKEPSNVMYRKTQWDEPERAPINKVIEILTEHVKKKKKEEPPKEIRSDEIKYLVQQKRKKAAKIAKDMLEEEKKRRHEELELLEELIDDVEEGDFDEEPMNIPTFMVEKPSEFEATEEVIRAAQGSKLQEAAIEAENKRLKKEIAEIVEARTLVEELPESFLDDELKKAAEAEPEKDTIAALEEIVGIITPEEAKEAFPKYEEDFSDTEFVASLESDVITIEEDDEMIEAISQEDAKEILEEFDTEEAVVEKKSLRDVISEAMNKMGEAENDSEDSDL